MDTNFRACPEHSLTYLLCSPQLLKLHRPYVSSGPPIKGCMFVRLQDAFLDSRLQSNGHSAPLGRFHDAPAWHVACPVRTHGTGVPTAARPLFTPGSKKSWTMKYSTVLPDNGRTCKQFLAKKTAVSAYKAGFTEVCLAIQECGARLLGCEQDNMGGMKPRFDASCGASARSIVDLLPFQP